MQIPFLDQSRESISHILVGFSRSIVVLQMSGSQQGQQATAGQVLPQLMNASSSQAIGQSPNGVTPGSDVIDLTDQLGVFANEDDF